MNLESLAQKKVILTGGGSGIGRASALALHQAGAHVLITGRNEDKLRSVKEAARGSAPFHYRLCDGTKANQVAETVPWALQQLGGRIDILVNNAGLNTKERSARSLSPDQWDQVIAANLHSAFYFIHAVLPVMSQQREGLIINITSVAGKRASKLGGAAYSASKFGMQALSLCVGLEEKDHGIRCTAIIPGEVDTPILDQRPEPVTAEKRKQILQPEDVAQAVLFVASLRSGVNVPELIITPTQQAYA